MEALSLSDSFLLAGAAIAAGALNAVAGGGSFIAFPMLLFTGVPPISANATNNIALGVGTLASVGAYRQELTNRRRELLLLICPSLLGSALGSLLLLSTPQAVFSKQIPYLLLLATLIFAFSGRLTKWLQQHKQKSTQASPFAKGTTFLLQLAISIYGGFFGGGMGILMLATLTLMGLKNIHTMNAFRTVLSTCINAVALIPFILAGVIAWPQAILMSTGALVGGYWSAHYARKLEPALVRRFVIVVGATMTLYFFLKNL